MDGDRAARLMEALKRDLDTLNGPAVYCTDRAFYEERIAGYRDMIRGIMESGGADERG